MNAVFLFAIAIFHLAVAKDESLLEYYSVALSYSFEYDLRECANDCAGFDAAVNQGKYKEFCELNPDFTCMSDCNTDGKDYTNLGDYASLHCACKTNQLFDPDFVIDLNALYCCSDSPGCQDAVTEFMFM
eukprot:CAMPEP_0171936102 /NCGR_PEP_ID=MMETSP0993-20121228/33550_1 /TAXON_ID=483369 /ORGANISM="non described non described, Strain CCMP2098" /LENGTH=129 /DNA_ID=CAMNT_0012577193 /DNA_START=51 /DNA_END=437 /DNA_ORIENTATION=+